MTLTPPPPSAQEKRKTKVMRPTGHAADVTVSVYGKKRGAGNKNSGRLESVSLVPCTTELIFNAL